MSDDAPWLCLNDLMAAGIDVDALPGDMTIQDCFNLRRKLQAQTAGSPGQLTSDPEAKKLI